SYSGVYETGIYHFSSTANTVIAGNTVFLPGTKVVVEENAIIRIAPTARLEFWGDTEWKANADNKGLIVSNDSMYSHGRKQDINQFDEIRFNNGSNIVNETIEGIVIKQTTNGFGFSGLNLHMKDCFLHSEQRAISTSNNTYVTIENSIIFGAASSVHSAVEIASCSGFLIKNCVFYLTPYGLRLTVVNEGTVDNNYFLTSNTAILAEFDVSATLINNTIHSSNIGIIGNLRTSISLTNNDINARIGLDLSGAFTGGNALANNFRCTERAIVYTSHYGGDFLATNSYWGADNQQAISELITDKNDFEPNHHYYNRYGIVVFMPYRTTAILNCGFR
ncbi:MAG: NosD domain-containing protein, partial [Candidatus Cloacimonadaceae bacterium]|nr:NosD domain-containing protein [Candidatus Cloacimonadaceae bacterium]